MLYILTLAVINTNLKKEYYILIIGLLTTNYMFSQTSELFSRDSSNKNNEIFYYPFSNGVQMIEIDNYSGYHFHEMEYFDMGYVPPYLGKTVNEYFFRDTLGQIIKSFNTNCNIDSISKVLKPAGFVNRNNHSTTLWNDFYNRSKLSGYYDVYEDSSQGVIDSLGNIVIPIDYKAIIHKPGCFLVNKDEKWSLITTDEFKLNFGFFDYYHKHGRLICFYKKKIEIVYNCQTRKKYNLSNLDEVEFLTEKLKGLALVRTGDKWGVWNCSNNTKVIPFNYESCDYFVYGGKRMYGPELIIVSKNGKYGLICFEDNQKPMIMLKCIYDKIYPTKLETGPPYNYKDGYITVEKNGQKLEYDINKLPLTGYKWH